MKKFLNIVLLISIIISLFASFPMAAGAEGTMPVSITSVKFTYEDNSVTADIVFEYANEDGVIYFALYDGEKLVATSQTTLSKDDTKKSVQITDTDENYEEYKAKIMCWGGQHNLTPLSKVYIETELIRRLKAVSQETATYIDKTSPDYTIFNNAERYILKIIKERIDDAVANHADEIDADFIRNYYEEEIKEVYDVYSEMKDQGKDDAFIGKLASNYTVENLIWLADTLGIDLEKYGIDVSKYR